MGRRRALPGCAHANQSVALLRLAKPLGEDRWEDQAMTDILLEALKNLYNEVAGTWSAFEHGIRAEISNTNYACVKARLDEAKSALAATPAVGILSREKSDQVLSECGYEPATPAVGGEPQALHGNFTERAIKLITEAAGHRDDWGKYEYAIIDLAREADAAQPASPLRGREAAELLAATEGLSFYKDDPERPSDKMTGVRMTFGELRRINKARADLAALSASPPEQPAPVTEAWPNERWAVAKKISAKDTSE
jgi:hypothetical protein